ncbi:hypothetical protein ACLOJK_024225 [Asimina triloba]
MPQEEEETAGESRIFLLEKELDAALQRNHSLEKDNEYLKQEVARLKAQLSTLKAQNTDRKSALWKKVQASINSSDEQKPVFWQSNLQEEPPSVEENSCPSVYAIEIPAGKNRAQRVPKPPPKRSLALRMPSNAANGKAAPPPPPPPPLPSKLKSGRSQAVRRVHEVLELYRSLTRREAKAEPKAGAVGNSTAANTRNMIGEIENRSAYQLAVRMQIAPL